VEHLIQVVGNKHHGHAVMGQATKQRQELGGLIPVKRRRWFIQDQDLWVVSEAP
jgi:hypothetical protein